MGENRSCSYCFREQPVADFSYEHIWPDALGGDHLSDLWQTHNVCQRCNSLCGLFVDGEFIKSWFGSNERSSAALDYIDPANPAKSTIPLHYMGPFLNPELRDDEVAEFWIGPCGAHNIHVRPKQEPLWEAYAGGKPSRKRVDWGSAFLSLTSMEHFWIIASVSAFHAHFKRAERICVNCSQPQGFVPPFSPIDPDDQEQARKLRVAQSVGEAAARGEKVAMTITTKADVGSRLLAKLALGIGRELLGEPFLETTYANELRRALWEKDATQRRVIPVRGTGYLSAGLPPGVSALLKWPGAWILVPWHTSSGLSLVIVTPSGRVMTVLVSDEAPLLQRLGDRLRDGEVFLTIPALSQAIGPIDMPAYLAHQTGVGAIPELVSLAAARRDPKLLPPCR